MSIGSASNHWLERWERVRQRLPSVNPVILGHPIHATLTDMPASLIPTGFAFSAWGRFTRNQTFDDAGYLTTMAGLIATVPTALTGLADYLQMEVTDPAQKTGFAHGLLNITAFGLGLWSVFDRRLGRPAPSRSLWLAGVATAVLSASAYLGGDLVYHRGWRVKPIEREEMEAHRVPDSVHDDDFVLHPAHRVSVVSGTRPTPRPISAT